MKRHMKADSLSMIRWWVDASYGVHWDCKVYTGAMMSMGKVATVNISRKHKLNSGSSTEAELVSIADVLGMICGVNNLWRRRGTQLRIISSTKIISPPYCWQRMGG